MTNHDADVMGFGDNEASTRRLNMPRLDMAISLLLAGALFGVPVIIVGFMLAAGTNWRDAAMALGGLMGVIAITMACAVLLLWKPMERRFPAKPIGDEAVARSGHSIALGIWCRFNGCITVIADRDHLHFVPVGMFRFFGARRLSMAWPQIESVRPSYFPGYSRAIVDGLTLYAPTWCLELADVSTAVDAAATQGDK